MSSRKTLKSVSVEELKPTVTLTPVIESCGEGCRIHHIKSDSIVRDGRDTFVPLRHVSKQKRRIFELEEENAKLREYAESYAKAVEGEGCGWCPYDIDLVCDTETIPMRDGCKLYDELHELGVKAR